MRRPISFVLAGAVATLGLALSPTAIAEDSTRGPFYVEGFPLGYNWTGVYGCTYHPGTGQTICTGGGIGGAFRLSGEFGYHVSGRHDGFVIGARQAFLFPAGGGVWGTTQARLGWDIAIPVRRFEITIAPYGVAGVAYNLNGGNAAFAFAGGAEGKFFFSKGGYACATPFELGSWVGRGFNGVVFQASVGIGYAF